MALNTRSGKITSWLGDLGSPAPVGQWSSVVANGAAVSWFSSQVWQGLPVQRIGQHHVDGGGLLFGTCAPPNPLEDTQK